VRRRLMRTSSGTLPTWLVAGFVALSGFCALVYQVVWERMVRFSFGGDSISGAIVTGTFLLGLGLGALLFGRWRSGAFAVFALVQLGVAAYAVASYQTLSSLARVLGRVISVSVAEADGVRLPLVVACILFLLPPCILIGGTTPLMFNCFIGPGRYRSSTVGWLYGLNTVGAALGVLAAPFVFLNRWSLPSTLMVVGAANLLLGIGIWLAGRRLLPLAPAEETEEGLEGPELGLPEGALLSLAFVSGFVSLALEISLIRAFFTLNPSSAYNFPAVLMPFLLAVGLGSIVLTRLDADVPERVLRRVGWLFVGGVCAMLLGVVASSLLTLGGLRGALREQSRALMLVVYAAVLVMPTPFLLSGVLPLLLRLASRTGRRLPAKSGTLYLANSVGAFAGAMLTQFVGFPFVGTRGVLTSSVALGALAGGACLMHGAPRVRRALASGGLALALTGAALLVPGVVWDLYTFGVTGANVDRVEGTSGVALIRWLPSGGRLYVNGQYMSSLPDDARHVQLVSFALSLVRREDVLLLGLGAGGAVRELVRDPAVRRVDVVDWSQELPKLLEMPRPRAVLADALRHPTVRLCRCDARVAVTLYEGRLFDIVIDDLAEASWVGATSVKSQAYFRQIRRILKPSGVFVYRGNYAHAREAVLAGLVSVFPVVQEHERGVVLCSAGPIAIDRERADEVLAARRRVLAIPTTRYADWLIGGLSPVPPDLPARVPPIRDELLIYEYPLDPLRALLPVAAGAGPSEGASTAPSESSPRIRCGGEAAARSGPPWARGRASLCARLVRHAPG